MGAYKIYIHHYWNIFLWLRKFVNAFSSRTKISIFFYLWHELSKNLRVSVKPVSKVYKGYKGYKGDILVNLQILYNFYNSRWYYERQKFWIFLDSILFSSAQENILTFPDGSSFTVLSVFTSVTARSVMNDIVERLLQNLHTHVFALQVKETLWNSMNAAGIFKTPIRANLGVVSS